MIDGAPMQKEQGIALEYTDTQIRRIQLAASNYICGIFPGGDIDALKELLSIVGVPHDRKYEPTGNRLSSDEKGLAW